MPRRISMSATEIPTRIEMMLAASASAIHTAAMSQTFVSTMRFSWYEKSCPGVSPRAGVINRWKCAVVVANSIAVIAGIVEDPANGRKRKGRDLVGFELTGYSPAHAKGAGRSVRRHRHRRRPQRPRRRGLPGERWQEDARLGATISGW